MKKIILIIALIVGGFTVQAQTDTISVFSFKSDSSQGFENLAHSFSEEFTHCNGNVIEASSIAVYSWNNSTGELSYNGTVAVTYTNQFERNALAGAFAASDNSLLSRNTFGGITGVIPTTGSGGSLTRN